MVYCLGVTDHQVFGPQLMSGFPNSDTQIHFHFPFDQSIVCLALVERRQATSSNPYPN